MSALVRELSPYVGRICGAIALDDGDDAMQETMISVLRNVRDLREPGAIRGWTRRIAVREAVRVARRREELHPFDAGDPDEPVSSLPDLDEAADVAAVLASLPPEQRAVLVLKHVDGLPEADIAALLDVPQGTVKSRLHRARSAFAARWVRT